MLHLAGGGHRPRMREFLVHRDGRSLETRIRKCAERDRQKVGQGLQLPVNGRSAHRAEVEGYRIAAVTDANERLRTPADLYPFTREASLNPKRASCTPLASVAVT